MRVVRRVAKDVQTVAGAARELAVTLRAGDVVAVGGPLGAGKTTFIAAAVRALQGSDEVTSPTFTFWHRYDGTPPVHHLDLYRVEDDRDLATIGLEEAFTSDAVVFVEWPERAPALLPPKHVTVTLDGSGEQPRTIEMLLP
ncbi:MAG: tRNA (adenosine(37)-N6)-threonylcarbamoyltransferase complex ATPase subunit type 1 TsaE [Candidatus Eremiobacteraeota bacterium]|nr:tRNA (adenosine(37)-N6)-threonylcarbamoyltransferase complex ATPase subunit type 1 TsaE [Candidatus Eremiobacteraeota bacterium]MBV9646858.1 tRNA (adenosine(37)-N6)-threonylcarbamoyltransferase complex ATPase subunit type 1 TsaE [Candidatus Eremiobacteraeota bacterium]